ncbi:folylpolyglutamate synthase [Spiromyces aspiralis]|uniref:Folylpolyglutamate synthase n=1 Tax=Spiromyces aspiralis TaxID=68401 RepID=A0ACC1HN79_9FUNG|nr:folylpolyglutamate synthase [Spiromyces aspiralis]
MNLGLDRILHCVRNLPRNPIHNLRIVHVTGTNGKGSVCALITSALVASGYRTGTFNSPHFIHPCDAIRINDRPISPEEYQSIVDQIQAWEVIIELRHGLGGSPVSPGFPALTQFEKTTVVALCWFMLNCVDIVVLEVGMGGRRDATNIFDVGDPEPSPLISRQDLFNIAGKKMVEFWYKDRQDLSSSSPTTSLLQQVAPLVGSRQPRSMVQCITAISIDHIELIGNSITEIAGEKAGIIRSGSVVVIGPQPNAEMVVPILQAEAQAKRAMRVIDASQGYTQIPAVPSEDSEAGHWSGAIRVRWPRDSNDDNDNGNGSDSSEFIELPLVLKGGYQAGNANTAYQALLALKRDFGWDKVSPRSLTLGFQAVNWPGRLSTLRVPIQNLRHLWPSAFNASGDDKRQLTVLADGAHNPAAAAALRDHVQCIAAPRKAESSTTANAEGSEDQQPSLRRRVRWVLGLTKGKDVRQILELLVNDKDRDEVWFVPFNKPDGMPWISSVEPQECLECLEAAMAQRHSSSATVSDDDRGCRVQARAFSEGLAQVLPLLIEEQAAEDNAGKYPLTVVCGSLYLVADLYRLLNVSPWSQ